MRLEEFARLRSVLSTPTATLAALQIEIERLIRVTGSWDQFDQIGVRE
jgi:hypothetical protein